MSTRRWERRGFGKNADVSAISGAGPDGVGETLDTKAILHHVCYPFAIMRLPEKRTNIICTIGPATESVAGMVQLGTAGMDVARLNFSHGTHEWHTRALGRLRQASRRVGVPFGILQDLQGPKIRVGDLPHEGVVLQAGREVVFTTSATPAPGDITVTLPELHRDVKRGASILLDDGLLECEVRRVEGRRIHCEVVHGGRLLSHKGLNLPGTNLKISALSDKDRADAAWGIKAGVDFMALSFVRNAADVKDLRRLLARSAAGRRIQIIAKIEKQEALDRFDEILPLVDAIMVARGDLGVETSQARVPIVQKQLVAACRAQGTPVIVATQFLDSMQKNPRPTRAEVSDIATAVADRADAVMLSGETASGRYPIEAVRVMADTIRATEASPEAYASSAGENGEQGPALSGSRRRLPSQGAQDVPELLGAAVKLVSDALGRAPIVVLTTSGRTAREVAAFRPAAAIHAMTSDPIVEHQCQLLWGVKPWLISRAKRPELRLQQAIALLRRHKAFPAGTRIVAVSGAGKPGSANKMEIVTV